MIGDGWVVVGGEEEIFLLGSSSSERHFRDACMLVELELESMDKIYCVVCMCFSFIMCYASQVFLFVSISSVKTSCVEPQSSALFLYPILSCFPFKYSTSSPHHGRQTTTLKSPPSLHPNIYQHT